MSLTAQEKKAKDVECSRRYRERHPDRVRASRERYKEKKRIYGELWTRCKADKKNTDVRQYARQLREQILLAYGAKCVCCGESEKKFLAIDHVNGGGNKEREKAGGQMGEFRLIRDSGFPDKYQILCHNCNMAKHIYGKCPHKDDAK